MKPWLLSQLVCFQRLASCETLAPILTCLFPKTSELWNEAIPTWVSTVMWPQVTPTYTVFTVIMCYTEWIEFTDCILFMWWLQVIAKCREEEEDRTSQQHRQETGLKAQVCSHTHTCMVTACCQHSWTLMNRGSGVCCVCDVGLQHWYCTVQICNQLYIIVNERI